MVREALMAGSVATHAASPHVPASNIAGTNISGGAQQSYSLSLAAVVECAASCLSSGGHLHYLGGGAAGVLGLIDASEQVPTFGARQTDVQGWVSGGRSELGVGVDPPPEGIIEISEEVFVAKEARGLREIDMVVVLVTDETSSGVGVDAEAALIEAVRERGVHVAVVSVSVSVGTAAAASGGSAVTAAAALRGRLGGGGGGTVLAVDVAVALAKGGKGGGRGVAGVAAASAAAAATNPPSPPSALLSLFAPRAAELAVKHILNGISTGAHVLLGKVWGARMIDVRVSNEKLFHRAARIVSEVAGVSAADAARALIRAIHEGRTELNNDMHQAGECVGLSDEDRTINDAAAAANNVGDEEEAYWQKSISSHVAAATDAERVVPIAVLLATV
jgi:N-acetylmuramic acid 6-phosphate (MurNAc-6-P) etherase